jgi:hypothetical protein
MRHPDILIKAPLTAPLGTLPQAVGNGKAEIVV